MRRVMIDLETFGQGENACIVQIGACDFDLDGGYSNCLKMNIDARDATRHGARLEADTVYWWMAQSDHARTSVITLDDRLDTCEQTALEGLNHYLQGVDEIWSHATFDFVIVMAALRRRGIKPKFSHRAARDIRTLNAMYEMAHGVWVKPRRVGVHHDALDDAVYQVSYVAPMIKAFTA